MYHYFLVLDISALRHTSLSPVFETAAQVGVSSTQFLVQPQKALNQHHIRQIEKQFWMHSIIILQVLCMIKLGSRLFGEYELGLINMTLMNKTIHLTFNTVYQK